MSKKFKILVGICFIFALFLCFCNLNTGFINLTMQDFISETDLSTVANLRINRVLVMLLAGISIPTSGFLLQEYFQNPLAGPSVLGISSVASLSVAFYLFISQGWFVSEFLQNGILSFFSILGSLILMLILIGFSYQKQEATVLIIFGFLISALSGAVVSILQLYADNQSLKHYILWSFGANAHITKTQIYILFFLVIVGLFFAFKTIKPLIGSVLGVDYAQSFGVNLQKLKLTIIIASSVLSASVTAFLGPILFIGIVVPHFCRMIYNPAKIWQQWILNMVIGVVIMEFFSIVSELSKFPMNIITSLFGIPVIFYMLLNKKMSKKWN
ncbi:MAG: ABC transporter permease [Flavobacteriales bacterium]|nr:MAG: ABC transporter permease [Flavobacteriales bacterium]